jgi:hypothetical protein
MNLCKKVVTGSAALLLAGAANVSMSAAIFMDPDPVLANVGDVVLVDLLWDGSGGEHLGGWDLDMSFDSAVLSFVNAVYDTDDALGDHVSFSTGLGEGLVNMFGLSFETNPDDLVARQDGLGNLFNLATIEFTAIGVGDIDVMLSGNAFSDPEGVALTDVMLTGSEACVDPVGTVPACGGEPMPEPGILPLFGLSLLALAFSRRRPLV